VSPYSGKIRIETRNYISVSLIFTLSICYYDYIFNSLFSILGLRKYDSYDKFHVLHMLHYDVLIKCDASLTQIKDER
jgi:hypothetical protein